jgi:hypothetical protein
LRASLCLKCAARVTFLAHASIILRVNLRIFKVITV